MSRCSHARCARINGHNASGHFAARCDASIAPLNWLGSGAQKWFSSPLMRITSF